MSVRGILDLETDPRLEKIAQGYLETLQAENGLQWLKDNRERLRWSWEFNKQNHITDDDLEMADLDQEGIEQDLGSPDEGDTEEVV